MWSWLLHFMGVRPLQPSYWYNFWSGFGANFGELALAGGLLAMVRQHNCHVHGCWRMGRHQVEGTPYKVCRRHHPDGHLTHAHLLASAAAARAVPDLSAQLKAHCADLKEHISATTRANKRKVGPL